MNLQALDPNSRTCHLFIGHSQHPIIATCLPDVVCFGATLSGVGTSIRFDSLDKLSTSSHVPNPPNTPILSFPVPSIEQFQAELAINTPEPSVNDLLYNEHSTILTSLVTLVQRIRKEPLPFYAISTSENRAKLNTRLLLSSFISIDAMFLSLLILLPLSLSFSQNSNIHTPSTRNEPPLS